MEVRAVTEREHDGTTLKVAIGGLVAHERKKAGMTIREVGAAIGYDHAYVHKVESGELGSEAVMAKLDELFGLDGTLSAFVYIARRGVLQDYGEKAVYREARAGRIQVCTSSTIPSLMCTPEYTRELLKAEWPKGPDVAIEEALSIKLKRQGVIRRQEPPLFWAMVDEGALKRRVGGDRIMHEQLSHVLKFCEKPHVTFQVIPFSAGAYWMMGGSLTLITSNHGRKIAYVESFGSGELVDSARRVIDLSHKFDLAGQKALSEEESLGLVKAYVEEYA